jgi:hypothetical protein
VRGDLPGLREGITKHGGGGGAATALDRRTPGEGVDHALHRLLPDRDVETGRLLERAAEEVDAGMRRADDKDWLPDLSAVDDQYVRAGWHGYPQSDIGGLLPGSCPVIRL